MKLIDISARIFLVLVCATPWSVAAGYAFAVDWNGHWVAAILFGVISTALTIAAIGEMRGELGD